ncbi:hypothetical protein C8Q74DRAFT_288971 [Fomes fomentarius]|nr:hypothetical protein C8Q74DRAFT_288971 [Fomes fomentarius]
MPHTVHHRHVSEDCVSLPPPKSSSLLPPGHHLSKARLTSPRLRSPDLPLGPSPGSSSTSSAHPTPSPRPRPNFRASAATTFCTIPDPLIASMYHVSPLRASTVSRSTTHSTLSTAVQTDEFFSRPLATVHILQGPDTVADEHHSIVRPISGRNARDALPIANLTPRVLPLRPLRQSAPDELEGENERGGMSARARTRVFHSAPCNVSWLENLSICKA